MSLINWQNTAYTDCHAPISMASEICDQTTQSSYWCKTDVTEIRTSVLNSIVAVVTEVWRRLLYNSGGAWHTELKVRCYLTFIQCKMWFSKTYDIFLNNLTLTMYLAVNRTCKCSFFLKKKIKVCSQNPVNTFWAKMLIFGILLGAEVSIT